MSPKRQLALKAQPRVQLHHSRAARACEAPERRTVQRGGQAREVRMIQKIERVCAELQLQPLGDGNILSQREIQVLEAGTANGSVSDIARPNRCAGDGA